LDRKYSIGARGRRVLSGGRRRTARGGSTLALLVFGILADDPHLAETANYFAFHAHFFN
jgi:hypothetical protein